MTKQAELKKQAYESDLKSRALSVLIYLIDRSNKDLTCFPAIPTMAEQLHISVSTVKRALHELVGAGFIKREARFRDKSRGQTSNLYTLVLLEKHEQMENKKGIEPISVEHIVFETLKTERVQSERHIDLPNCEEKDANDIIVEQSKINKKSESGEVKQSQRRKKFLAQKIIVRMSYQMYRGQICNSPYFFLPQLVPRIGPQWTGEGGNLHPP